MKKKPETIEQRRVRIALDICDSEIKKATDEMKSHARVIKTSTTEDALLSTYYIKGYKGRLEVATRLRHILKGITV